MCQRAAWFLLWSGVPHLWRCLVLTRHTSLAILLGTCGLLSACAREEDGPPNSPRPPATPGDFESAAPSLQSGSRVSGPASQGAAGASAAGPLPGATEGSDSGDGAARAIEEADVIKLQDGRLYALSRYGGLSVVDVSQRDRLRLLGRHKIVATPFEMYVREGIVFALYNDFGRYTFDEATEQWSYYQTSEVVAMDARDPSAIEVIGRFTIPGYISDSRIVGDILYVSAFENGSCWGCEENRPRTNVISLDVSAPAAISKVDELSLEERTDGYSWQRSMTATDQRLYLAGPTWGNNEPVGSTIQVVDISDPGGDLREGAAVQVSGQIQSRWQMDEYEGVLRVVSQPFTWRLDTPPSVETFAVVSSNELTPLGNTTMTLPRPEQLQSVRFDGDRGYAVTFERTDPLFTLDLSDPTRPKQVGELEMPGFLYHMEPRGDRLLGLGFDQGNEAGALTVSLFDVSNLATPTMLSRVNFGGDWASLAEGQDQIHKAFNVLDSAGLLLVPFSGHTFEREDPSRCGRSTFTSGVQLIDWATANDTLALRGVAPAKGLARRGFLHDDRLFTMSDERVESFDITNRDTPSTTASLPLAQFVNHVQGAGNRVVRVGQNWWSQTTELDVTTVAGAASPSALGRVELPQLSENSCYGGTWLNEVASSEDAAYLVYESYEYDPANGNNKSSGRVVTVDVSNPSAPAVAADAKLDFIPTYPHYVVGAVDSGARLLTVGTTLVMAHRTQEYVGSYNEYDYLAAYVPKESALKAIDLSDPTSPVVTSVPLPKALAATGLLRSGTIVATSSFEVTGSGNGRFFLDRVDLGDPAEPTVLPRVNIPGSLLAYDAAHSRAVTLDYRTLFVDDLTAEQCYQRYNYRAVFLPPNAASYDWMTTKGRCRTILHTLRLVEIRDDGAVVLASHELGENEWVGATALGDDRLFVTLGASGGIVRGGYAVGPGFYPGYYGFSNGPVPILVLGGLRDGDLTVGRVELEGGDSWGYTPLVASGTHAAVATGFRGKLTVIDASRANAPRVAREVELGGYVQDLDVVGNTAIASLGQDGAAAIPLSK